MKTKLNFSTLLCCLLLVHSTIFSQLSGIRFEHYTTNDGLSNNVISNIYADARGYLWLVTPSGLCNFNGSQFRAFTSNNQAPLNEIFAVQTFLTDSAGNFWMGGFHTGLIKYYDSRQQLITYKDTVNARLHSNTINCIVDAGNNNLWLGTAAGLNKFDIKNTSFAKIENPPSSGVFNIISIISDKSGVLWILLKHSLYSFNPITNSYTLHCTFNFLATALLEIEPGKFWIAGEGFKVYNSNSRSYDLTDENRLRHVWKKSPVLDFCRTSTGNIWIATDGAGIFIYNPVNKSLQNIQTDDFDNNSLSSNAVYKIYEDSRGIIWIGTVRGGLNKWAAAKWKFKHYYNNPLKSNSLSNNVVNAFCEDSNGYIWLGTAGGGLNRFNPENEAFMAYRYDAQNPFSLSNNVVTGIIEDHNKNLWVATYSNGINLFNRKQNLFYRFNKDGKGKYRFPLNSFLGFCISNKFLFIASHGGGLIKMNIENYEYQSFVHDPNEPTSICSNYVAEVFADHEGNIWAATSDGLDFLPKNSTRFKHYKHIESDSTTISYSVVNTIREDFENNIWVGTAKGLSCLNPLTGKCKRYGLANGLPDLMIFGILQDNQGFMWISTNNGLCRLNPKSGEVKIFDKADGLQDKQFNQGALKTKNGELYFGGVNGFNSFLPENIKESSVFPQLVVNDLKLYNRSIKTGNDVNGRQILEREMSETTNIKLNYTDWVFTLEFTALEFALPEKIKYAYMLENFDTRWNYTNATRKFATYTNLNPGGYIFRLKSTNSDGTWNTTEKILTIEIVPPFWLTWWFRGIIALLITGAVLQFYFTRINRIKKQKLILENKVIERAAQLNKAHTRLEESNTRFEKLFEYANDAIFILNLSNFNIEMMNIKAKEIPDILNMRNLNFCDFSGLSEQFLKQKFTEEAIFEAKIERENNSSLILEISTKTFYETNKPLGLLICRDITERMKIMKKIISQKELIINQQNEIEKLDFEKSKIENAKLSIELDSQKREIASKTIALLHQNEIINKLIKKLGDFKIDDRENRRNLDIMVAELKQQLNHNIWKEFTFCFEQVDPEFYKKLDEKFPHLSLTEKRLCALLRLNLTTKEIALLTLKGPAGIDVARSRLRKKMDIGREHALQKFIVDL